MGSGGFPFILYFLLESAAEVSEPLVYLACVNPLLIVACLPCYRHRRPRPQLVRLPLVQCDIGERR